MQHHPEVSLDAVITNINTQFIAMAKQQDNATERLQSRMDASFENVNNKIDALQKSVVTTEACRDCKSEISEAIKDKVSRSTFRAVIGTILAIGGLFSIIVGGLAVTGTLAKAFGGP